MVFPLLNGCLHDAKRKDLKSVVHRMYQFLQSNTNQHIIFCAYNHKGNIDYHLTRIYYLCPQKYTFILFISFGVIFHTITDKQPALTCKGSALVIGYFCHSLFIRFAHPDFYNKGRFDFSFHYYISSFPLIGLRYVRNSFPVSITTAL